MKFVLLGIAINVLLLPNCVFAFSYGMGVEVNFDKSTYSLGFFGTVTISITSYFEPSQVSVVGICLYFTETNGSIYRSDFFGDNYGSYPVYVNANDTVILEYRFQIPNNPDIVSGYLYYVAIVHHQEYGTTEYSEFNTLLDVATSEGSYCTITNHSQPASDYNSLQSSHNSLQSIYNSLLSNYVSPQPSMSRFESLQDRLNIIQALMNIFVVTTIIFITTTVLFARALRLDPWILYERTQVLWRLGSGACCFCFAALSLLL